MISPKREVVGERRRRRLEALAGELGRLTVDYPDLHSTIVHLTDIVLQEAVRTRKSDRETVFKKLEEWDRAGGLTVKDLAEDTGLTTHAVREVLAELTGTQPPLVGYRERPGVAGQPQRIYFLIHELPTVGR